MDFDSISESHLQPKTMSSLFDQNGDYQKGLAAVPTEYTDLASMLLKVISA